MTFQIHNCEQGSDEWFRVRAGLPTASEFASILAKGEGKTRRAYMLRLAGEIITGAPTEGYSNAHMERGKVMEAEARDLYVFLKDAVLTRVGFVSNGRKGCSPDSLVGDDGVLEIKTALPHILIDKLLRGDFPPEHRAQCQGALWVTERTWVDIAVYWPGLPLFVKRQERDETYIAALAKAVDEFNAELDATVEIVRGYGKPPAWNDNAPNILAAG